MAAALNDPIWRQRGLAINEYANLEQALLMVMSITTGMPPGMAGTIFFKITSTQARAAILEKLIHKKFGSTYNLFWNSVFAALKPLDLRRNEIVHWHAAAEVLRSDIKQVSVKLIPANYWDATPDRPMLGSDDLIEFTRKCDCYKIAIMVFCQAHTEDDTPNAQAWRAIFLQPFVYPPPEDHPIFRWPRGLRTLPRPSHR